MFEESRSLWYPLAPLLNFSKNVRVARDALLQATLEIVRPRVRVFDIDMQAHAHSSYALVRTGSSSTLMTLPTAWVNVIISECADSIRVIACSCTWFLSLSLALSVINVIFSLCTRWSQCKRKRGRTERGVHSRCSIVQVDTYVVMWAYGGSYVTDLVTAIATRSSRRERVLPDQ